MPHSRIRRSGPTVLSLLAVGLVLGAMSPVAAQNGGARSTENTANWALAERFSNEALSQYVHSTSVQPNWIGETDSAWYRWKDDKGTRYMLIEPRSRQKQPLFNHFRLSSQLTEQGVRPREAHDLELELLSFSDDRRSIVFMADSIRFRYDLGSERLQNQGRWTRQQIQDEQRRLQQLQGGGGGGGGGAPGAPGGTPDFRNFSPDSTAFVFARDHNLYIVEVATGDTTQLSRDGVEYYSFGARDTTAIDENVLKNMTQEERDRARDARVRTEVDWSPDSRAFSVLRTDRREVADLYLVNSLKRPRPALIQYRYSMPGEEKVPQTELFVYRRGQSSLVEVPADRWKDQLIFDVHWTIGSEKLRFVRRDRLQRNLELVEADVPTLATRVIVTESTENSYLEHLRWNKGVLYLGTGGDFIWYSERTGWGHYYLHDHNGTLKNAITSGPWRADDVIAIDTVNRTIFIAGVGREPSTNASYRHLYRVNANGTGLTHLTSGDAEHTFDVSPTKRVVVDSYSRVDQPTVSVLRDLRGNVVTELEKFDDTRLRSIGWVPPEPFVVKSADGVTNIYGVMWKPFDFDPSRRYPIIAHVYPGPQGESVTTGFSPNNSNQHLAQLGFIVIQIGNRGGNPRRSNAYHSYGYYNLRDYGLADKKAGIEQLAALYPWIDIERVGIYGHSGGGFMTGAALLVAPYNEFFKVGVSSAGNHDNNVYNQNWSETNHGLRQLEKDGEISFEIRIPANHEVAANLKGRLLIAHGDNDNNVHHAGSMRLADALIKANKRFDMFIFPGTAHSFGGAIGPYWQRMIREYFAEHLIGDYYRAGADIK